LLVENSPAGELEEDHAEKAVAGEEAHPSQAASEIEPAPVTFAFRCEQLLLERIHFEDASYMPLPALEGRQMAEWRAYVRFHEPLLPGLAKTAFALPLATCCGLQTMRGKEQVDGDQVLELAKWLVRRMDNRFAASSCLGAEQRQARLAERLLEKLKEHGPMKIREMLRRSYDLKSRDCRKALAMLARMGLATEQQGQWSIPTQVAVAASAEAQRAWKAAGGK
jgi:hypothetical protein